MPEPTRRDRCWTVALTVANRKKSPIKPDDLAKAAQVSEQTARDVLNVMSEVGWLRRDVLPDGRVRFLEGEHVHVDEEWQVP